jgi:hypothetical protein
LGNVAAQKPIPIDARLPEREAVAIS